MTEYAITLSHSFHLDLGSFLFMLRPLIAIIILVVCLYFIWKKLDS